MNNIKRSLALFGVLLAGMLLFNVGTTQALDSVPLTDEHKERIVAHCTSARASLQQLHRSDTSLRVNRGRLYEFVSAKLMAPLNSRLAYDQFDSGELVNVTARYGRAVNSFREAYLLYETQLSAVLRINCTKQPELFYYGVLDAQQKRAVVYERVQEVRGLAAEYYEGFDDLRFEYRAAVRGMSSE